MGNRGNRTNHFKTPEHGAHAPWRQPPPFERLHGGPLAKFRRWKLEQLRIAAGVYKLEEPHNNEEDKNPV